MMPRQIEFSASAAVFSVQLEGLFEITADRNGQVQFTQAPIGKVDADEPAVSIGSFEQPRLNAGNLAAEKPRRVDQVAPVGEHEVAAFVRLGVPAGTLHLFAESRN